MGEGRVDHIFEVVDALKSVVQEVSILLYGLTPGAFFPALDVQRETLDSQDILVFSTATGDHLTQDESW